ncbi:hypothetical protein ACFY78_21200 [Streptomyces olindensis]|uniref:hypothetical protein n=1 Tax=Streptomyces olindensis TaxID=358823 RepID=UPI00368739B6
MTNTEPKAPDTETDELQRLGEQLLRTAKSSRARAAVQALVEERTILAVPAVRRALVTDTLDGAQAHFEALSGRQYGLGLDEGQRAFLHLVLPMVGIGITTLASVQDLDDHRLPIMLRAILRLTGNNDIAVGRHL